MRILHAGPAYHPEGPGGIEVYLASLCRQQRAAGHDPVVLTGCAEAWPRVGLEEAQVDGCRVLRVHRDDLFFHHYAKAFHPGVEDLFDRVLSDERPDLVHVHHWLRLTCNLVEIAGRRGVPAVVTLHDTYASCPRCWRIDRDLAACSRELGVAACLPCVPRWGCESDDEIATGIELFRAAHRHELTAARAVLAPSRALGELVARTTGLDGGRIRELPLGYERRAAAPPAPPLPPAAGEPLRLAHWGNLGRHKGVVPLLRAVRQLAQRGAPRPFELHLFGPIESPALADELARLADGVPVTFHGRFSFADVARARPHVGVFPSLCFESFSFALEECFELRLPCIVTDLGALPQRAGQAALVVAHGDVDALAGAIARLMADPRLLGQLAAAVPALAPDPRTHSAALQRVYEGALVAPPPSATPAVTPQQWLRLAVRQRDNAQARICPEGGPS